jgi:hypothetical protein
MASHRISVRRVLELGVLVTWQEAVAVVHEVAILSVVNASRNGEPSRIDADSCIITRRGDVELPQSTSEPRPDAPLQLLRELLAGRETPADLEALAYGAPSENLTDDLAMFSRPNRRSEIANLAMRALDAEQELAQLGITPPAVVGGVQPTAPAPTSAEDRLIPPPLPAAPSMDDELAKLRDQVAGRPAPSPDEVAPVASRRSPQWGLRAAAAAVVVIAVIAGWWGWSVSPPRPADAPAARMPQGLGPVELNPAWHIVGRREADIELGQRAANRTNGAVADMAATVGVAAASPSVAASDGLGSNTAPPATATGASEPPPVVASSDPNVDALFADDSVYSMANAAVRPPLMMFPRMPRSAFPGPSETVDGAYFEVLVDQQGGVEAVRLRGREQPGHTFYRARMMLSAAKAWQFEPARIDGRPVRYVVRVVPEP